MLLFVNIWALTIVYTQNIQRLRLKGKTKIDAPPVKYVFDFSVRASSENIAGVFTQTEKTSQTLQNQCKQDENCVLHWQKIKLQGSKKGEAITGTKNGILEVDGHQKGLDILTDQSVHIQQVRYVYEQTSMLVEKALENAKERAFLYGLQLNVQQVEPIGFVNNYFQIQVVFTKDKPDEGWFAQFLNMFSGKQQVKAVIPDPVIAQEPPKQVEAEQTTQNQKQKQVTELEQQQNKKGKGKKSKGKKQKPADEDAGSESNKEQQKSVTKEKKKDNKKKGKPSQQNKKPLKSKQVEKQQIQEQQQQAKTEKQQSDQEVQNQDDQQEKQKQPDENQGEDKQEEEENDKGKSKDDTEQIDQQTKENEEKNQQELNDPEQPEPQEEPQPQPEPEPVKSQKSKGGKSKKRQK